MTDKHTPKPWKSGGCVVYGPDGAGVADLVAGICNRNGRSPDETEANALFILRAVNNHAELLKALEHVHTTLDNITGDRELLETYLPLLLQDVRAAIKAAKGDA